MDDYAVCQLLQKKEKCYTILIQRKTPHYCYRMQYNDFSSYLKKNKNDNDNVD